jgi:hypothetical protein
VPTDPSARTLALERLEPFVGEWQVEVALPGAPTGRTVFEWALSRQFLLERSEVPNSDVPDSFAIIAFDPNGEPYTQHYFDSRGVVRVYAMGLRDGVWTLVRNAPDFTPLDFSQRFVGTFADEGTRIDGSWETSTDGVHWELDFDLTYTKAA